VKVFYNGLTISIIILVSIFLLQEQASANVFAGQLKITNPDGTPFDGSFSDGTNALLSFVLNDTASTVIIDVADAQSNTTIHQISSGSMSRGLNSVEWDGTGSQNGHEYTFVVTAEQPNASNTEWSLFYDSGDIDIFTRGVACFNDQSDTSFGLIYTANDGGPLGTGINIYEPDGSFHNPFLVAADVTSGGTINYGSEGPLFAVLDSQGRIYVTAMFNGEIYRINRDYSAQVIIDGLNFPKGLFVEGEGQDFTIYVAADQQILKAPIGTDDTFPAANMELIADFSGFYPHQIMRDDDGALYTTLRANNDLGSDGRGIRKYDISGSLPVTDNDALWFLMENKTFIANDLLLDHGLDPNSSTDDILYYCTRAGSGFDQDGIWRINDINSFFPDTVRIMTEETFYITDENVNARATIDFDAAGNIVFMENSNEHVFFLSPPGTGSTNSFTSKSADTVLVGTVDIGDSYQQTPYSYRLEANYPNPFNPSTVIEYYLGKAGATTLRIFNMMGEEVRTLVNENKTAGQYRAIWNGKNNQGASVASGVYILRLQSGDFQQSRRITLLK
jgi:hypothetical protein